MTGKSLYDIVERLVELAAPRASAAGLSLSCSIDCYCHNLEGIDEWCVSQVLNNLLTNALTYTKSGYVTVSVACTDDAVSESESGFCIAIEDSGPGIDASVRRLMFALPEEREALGATDEMGLGLVIAKQLCELMGATLTVEASDNGGTLASIRGTIIESTDQATDPLELVSVLRDTHALVIDTELSARRVLEAHLRGWGIRVTSALDVNAAFARIDQCNEADQAISMVFVSGATGESDMRRLANRLDASPRHSDALLMVVGSDATTGTNRILDEHNGNVTLLAPVRASELYNCISQHPAIVDRLQQTDTITVSRLDSRRVLLVEDNVVNQCVASEILKRIGIDAVVANNGREALRRLTSERFDFVFMDCQMPEMDGFEATRRIREDLQLTDLPIVALTANALDGDRRACLNAGMDDYLTKPFTQRQLELMLSKWTQPSDTENSDGATLSISDDQLIDNDALDQIRVLDEPGKNDILNEIIGEYLNSADSLTEDIATAVEDSDSAGVGRAAHALKSSSAAVGLAYFSNQCAELERMSIKDDLAAIQSLWREMLPLHKRSVELLQQLQQRQ
ncbi:MAG: response regulator, partial [Pseudomonadota bacterium]